MEFTHLHLHTEYSLLDSSLKIREVVSEAKRQGMDKIAITDHGNMFGVIDFYKQCKKEGVKPIIGCEIYVANTSLYSRSARSENYYNHLVILAENDIGLSNLNKITSKGYIDGFYYRPRVDKEFLKEHSEGLIALSACLAGPINRKLLRESYESAYNEAKEYADIFGKNKDGEPNFYVEIQNHGIEEQLKTNPLLIKIAKELDLPIVCTNDVHYTKEEDKESHELLLCINSGKNILDDDRIIYEGGQFYLKSPEEMAELFSYIPEAVENTEKIANRCNVNIVFGEYKLPKFDTPDGYEATDYLRELTETSLKEKYGTITDEIQQRLDYEIKIISDMGFIDYFLIVWDFIKYARDNDITVGPGRGSAAGSLVSYALGITSIDPIKYNLLFERFLNPERVSMPDIDIDFCYERRHEVIEYVVDKYGSDSVSQIITFGTLAARAAVRDTGRALAMPYSDVDRIAKMIPKILGINLEKALAISDELKTAYDNEEDTKKLIDFAMKLEGLPRHSSTHAAGVLIADKPITEYVPLASNDGAIVSQYTMTTLEELGLLKMDFLGLRTLTVIQNAVNELIQKKKLKEDFDIERINYDEIEVFEMIGQGKTEGVFQLESAGMKSFMKELRPTSLEDVIAGISLYRPGPMDFIPKYIKGKTNKDNIEYTCDALIPILKTTYGCIVYQEQVMEIFRELAGYSLGRSDLVRRAMSKKKLDVMEQEREVFIYGDNDTIKGCVNNGITKEQANQIFDEMAEFAKYAFNKSHAAAYAVVGYQTAWLKYHYPLEFMSALLTSVMDSSDKIAEYILECKTIGIPILAPNINESFGKFVSTDNGILFGLQAIKNVGKNVAISMVEERKKGKFKTFSDFIKRMPEKDINKRAIESLIFAGAFDCLGGKRSQYFAIHENTIKGIKNNNKRNIEGQLSFFDIDESMDIIMTDDLPKVDEFNNKVLLQYEKSVLGVYLSGHPLNDFTEVVDKRVTIFSKNLALIEGEEDNRIDKQKGTICGIVMKVNTMFTKKNDQMAFVTIEDLYGEIEIVVFPNMFEKYRELLKEETAIVVTGTTNIREDENGKFICDSITLAADLLPQKKLFIKINETSDKVYIFSIIKTYPGKSNVIIYNEDTKEKSKLSDKYNFDTYSIGVGELMKELGEENVVIK